MIEPFPEGDGIHRFADGHRQAHGEQIQGHGKNQQHHHRQPEDRTGLDQQTVDLDQPIQPAPLIGRRKNAQKEAHDAGQYPGQAHQDQGHLEALRDDLDDRSAVGDGRAHVTLQDVAQPAEIARHRRVVQAPLFRDGIPQFLADGVLPHIRGNRVDGRELHQGKGDHRDGKQQNQHFDQRIYRSLCGYFQIFCRSFLSSPTSSPRCFSAAGSRGRGNGPADRPR